VTNSVVEEVTRRIAERSDDSRTAYLERIRAAAQEGRARGQPRLRQLRARLRGRRGGQARAAAVVKPNVAIVSSYNDMLSAAPADTSGTSAGHRHDMATVPAHAGLDPAGRGLLPRRLRGHPDPDLRLLRPGSPPSLRPHPRHDQPSDRSVDHLASPQPPDGPRLPRAATFRFLVRDRADQFTTAFDSVLAGAGIDTWQDRPGPTGSRCR